MSKTNQKSNSLLTMVSYGIGKFHAEFFSQAFGVLVFFYYETEVLLDLRLAAIGFIIYAIWNAFNDPIIGFFTEKRTTRFTKRFGRRFPWVMGGIIVWVFTFILIFFIPAPILTNQFLLFLWMVLSTCLFDTLYSLWDVNYQSIFPDKFREDSIRNRVAGIATGIGVFGIATGFILPNLFITYGQPQTFITNSLFFAIIGFFIAFLLIPGVRETPDMIERYLNDREKETETSFIQELKEAFKVRNFVAWIIIYFFYQSAVVMMTGSVHYIGRYILPGGSADTTIIFVGLLGGALIAIPIWTWFAKRIKSNQKTMMITALFMALFALPLTLPIVNTYASITLFIFLFGLGFGGYWMIMTPALADVIDEIVVKTGRRNDGIFMGFRAFFGRFAFAVQGVVFFLVHGLTGFAAGVTEQTPLALLGLHSHIGIIPALLLVIGVLVFWKLNDLNPEKVERLKAELVEKAL
ncbi:MAG: MFS transporter [Promethearchaeota archaeon]